MVSAASFSPYPSARIHRGECASCKQHIISKSHRELTAFNIFIRLINISLSICAYRHHQVRSATGVPVRISHRCSRIVAVFIPFVRPIINLVFQVSVPLSINIRSCHKMKIILRIKQFHLQWIPSFFLPFVKPFLCKCAGRCGLSQYIDCVRVTLNISEHIFCWIFNYKMSVPLIIYGVLAVSEWNDKVGMLDQRIQYSPFIICMFHRHLRVVRLNAYSRVIIVYRRMLAPHACIKPRHELFIFVGTMAACTILPHHIYDLSGFGHSEVLNRIIGISTLCLSDDGQDLYRIYVIYFHCFVFQGFDG